jgi:hypothetical protein
VAKKGYSLYSPTASLKRRLYRRSRKSRAFAGLAGTLVIVRALRRAVSSKPEVIAVDRLRIGQSMSVTLLERPTRRQKRAARKAGVRV